MRAITRNKLPTEPTNNKLNKKFVTVPSKLELVLKISTKSYGKRKKRLPISGKS